jgi:hypothetical protein
LNDSDGDEISNNEIKRLMIKKKALRKQRWNMKDL